LSQRKLHQLWKQSYVNHESLKNDRILKLETRTKINITIYNYKFMVWTYGNIYHVNSL